MIELRLPVIAQMAATIYCEKVLWCDTNRSAREIAVREAILIYDAVEDALSEAPARGSALPPPSPGSSSKATA